MAAQAGLELLDKSFLETSKACSILEDVRTLAENEEVPSECLRLLKMLSTGDQHMNQAGGLSGVLSPPAMKSQGYSSSPSVRKEGRKDNYSSLAAN